MLEAFDKNVSLFTESLARQLSRRKMVSNTVKGLFAAVGVVTIGQLAQAGQALAAPPQCTCDDGWTTGQPCDNYGYPCPHDPHDTCPSGCSICTTADSCNGFCTYSSGSWVACQNGRNYRLCYDCKCPDCSVHCSCLSGPVH